MGDEVDGAQIDADIEQRVVEHRPQGAVGPVVGSAAEQRQQRLERGDFGEACADDGGGRHAGVAQGAVNAAGVLPAGAGDYGDAVGLDVALHQQALDLPRDPLGLALCVGGGLHLDRRRTGTVRRLEILNGAATERGETVPFIRFGLVVGRNQHVQLHVDLGLTPK